MTLATRVDAILAGRDPAPARSFTIPVGCRQCAHDGRRHHGLEVLAIDTPAFGPSRVHTRCIQCKRQWTYTVTCITTREGAIDTRAVA